jgi:hypothetical protein
MSACPVSRLVLLTRCEEAKNYESNWDLMRCRPCVQHTNKLQFQQQGQWHSYQRAVGWQLST